MFAHDSAPAIFSKFKEASAWTRFFETSVISITTAWNLPANSLSILSLEGNDFIVFDNI